MKNNFNYQKSRKFTYEIKNVDTYKLEKIKQIKCRYHLIIFDYCDYDINVEGFIYFDTPRSINSIIKLIGYDNVTTFNDKIIDMRNSMNEFWEYGILPKQGKKNIIHNEPHVEKKMLPPIPCPALTSNDYLENTMITLLHQTGEQNKELMNSFTNFMIQLRNLSEENIDMKNQMESIATSVSNIHSNITNNVMVDSNNKTFNINVFLNEHCKDAVTMSEFIDDIKVEESDLHYTQKYGLVNSITGIMTRKLDEYGIHRRPIHCTDTKRESIYVKDSNGWSHEVGKNDKKSWIIRAGNYISHKHIVKLKEYLDENPELTNVYSPHHDNTVKLMLAVQGGYEDDVDILNKIKRNIVKEVYINKQIVSELHR